MTYGCQPWACERTFWQYTEKLASLILCFLSILNLRKIDEVKLEHVRQREKLNNVIDTKQKKILYTFSHFTFSYKVNDIDKQNCYLVVKFRLNKYLPALK